MDKTIEDKAKAIARLKTMRKISNILFRISCIVVIGLSFVIYPVEAIVIFCLCLLGAILFCAVIGGYLDYKAEAEKQLKHLEHEQRMKEMLEKYEQKNSR